MFDFVLLPDEKRTLKKMRGRQSVPKEDIYNYKRLLKYGLIVWNFSGDKDALGQDKPDGTLRLSEKYWRYIQSERWFTPEFVIRNVVIPVAVGISSSIITAILLHVL